MSTLKELNDLLIEGFIQSEIFVNHRAPYPDDIRHSICLYYHNPSYFMKAGNLCTINRTKNMLTYECSNRRQFILMVIIRIIDIIIRGLIIAMGYQIGAFCIDYSSGDWEDGFIAYVINYRFYRNISTPLYFSMLIIYFFYKVYPEPLGGNELLSTTNGCYGSILMPSIIPKTKNDQDYTNFEYKYKLKILECAKNVNLSIGLADDHKIDLNRPYDIMSPLFPYMVNWNNSDEGYGEGDILSMVYMPQTRLMTFQVNDNQYNIIKFTNMKCGPVINYRLYITIAFTDNVKPWNAPKIAKIQML